MFQRRKKLRPHHRLLDFLWPRIGFRRSLSYLSHRVGRLPGTPHAIAAGFAFGAAVSFTPFVGLHFVLAAVLAWATRTHIIASAIGTAFGNPWTFPLIWAWIYTLGTWLLGINGSGFEERNFSLAYLWEHPWDVLLPMVMGSIPTAMTVWFVVYLPLRLLIGTYQKRRRARRLRKLQQRKVQTYEAQKKGASA